MQLEIIWNSFLQHLSSVCVCRFDSELSGAQEEVQRERTLREKLSREKDMLTGDVFSLRQQLEVHTLLGFQSL